jgi:tripartite-type tricarboxylate transporter receptor subunit TctC
MAIAPAGTPADVVTVLNNEIGRIVAEPEIRAQATQLGMLAVAPATSAELAAFVKSEIGRWAGLVERAGIAGSQ